MKWDGMREVEMGVNVGSTPRFSIDGLARFLIQKKIE